jgi:hypothetical protein
VPNFWDVLVREARNGRLLSIDRVKAEIDRGNDRLKQWANHDFRPWFVSTNVDSVLEHYRAIMQWTAAQHQFKAMAKDEFADVTNADPWVVAYAKATSGTVVTNEQYDTNITRRIKIPHVCKEFAVPCVNTFEMLRALGVRL